MIFADTSFFFANLVAGDRHHYEATMLHAAIKNRILATSNHVRGETWTLLRRRRGHTAAVRFLAIIEKSHFFEIHRVEPALEREALNWLYRHDEREYSFVDATSFALMRKLGITEALAFDGDFAAAGFVELRP